MIKRFLALMALLPCLALTLVGWVAAYCWLGLIAGWDHGHVGWCNLVDACGGKARQPKLANATLEAAAAALERGDMPQSDSADSLSRERVAAWLRSQKSQ